MKNILALALILSACTPTTKIVEVPVKPTPVTQVRPTPTPTPVNHAEALVNLVTPLKAQGYECSPWTGSGTTFPGIDSYVCTSKTHTNFYWCGAPTNDVPRCVVAVDWTPPPTPVEPSKTPSKK